MMRPVVPRVAGPSLPTISKKFWNSLPPSPFPAEAARSPISFAKSPMRPLKGVRALPADSMPDWRPGKNPFAASFCSALIDPRMPLMNFANFCA